MLKTQLRKQMLEWRRAMSLVGAASRSTVIQDRLKRRREVAECAAVLCYVSSKDNEVDTHAFIHWLLDSGKTVLVPIALAGGEMLWSRLCSFDELEQARFGILEPIPKFRRLTVPPKNSVAIVPGIAFSPQGHRIGYGGGYYDRFLAGYSGVSIGLAFDGQIVPAWEAQDHDVPVDYVITESRTLQRTT